MTTTPDEIRGLLDAAAFAGLAGRPDYARMALARLLEVERTLVASEAEPMLLQAVADLWANGWQPAELHREMRRSGSAAAARLGLVLIGASHAGIAAKDIDARWAAQLHELRMPSAVTRTGWLARWWGDRAEAVAVTIDLLRAVGRLPALQVLMPPPGSTMDPRAAFYGADVNDPVLDRVRALLAQAESTTFEGEAEAFTAKAHQLMARHAIDAARLASESQLDERPTTVRVPIDDPYLDIKSLLLQTVALNNRCRSVYTPSLGLSTVVGFASDIGAVELLFTSLLVQAQSAMVAAARTAPPGARTRSRSYRSAFLLSYTTRIGDRLEEISASVLADAEAELGMALVPVLEGREEDVQEALGTMFPEMRSSAVRGGHDPAGWAGGRQAADLAKLSAAELADAAHPAREG